MFFVLFILLTGLMSPSNDNVPITVSSGLEDPTITVCVSGRDVSLGGGGEGRAVAGWGGCGGLVGWEGRGGGGINVPSARLCLTAVSCRISVFGRFWPARG